MRTWVPGRAVPWGLGRLPWAPRRLPGAPRGGSRPQTTRINSAHFHLSSLRIRINIHVDFDISFWSFWARSWVPLGGHFLSCWRLCRPKLVPEMSSSLLIFEKHIFHETHRFPIENGLTSTQDGRKIRPRLPQDGSKIVLDRLFSPFDFRFDFDCFRLRLGAVLDAQMRPWGWWKGVRFHGFAAPSW